MDPNDARERENRRRRMERFGVESRERVESGESARRMAPRTQNPTFNDQSSARSPSLSPYHTPPVTPPKGEIGDLELDGAPGEPIRGTCPYFCPEREIAARERLGDIDRFECVPGTEKETNTNLAIKKYTRTPERSAELIRPLPVLQRCMDHMLDLLHVPHSSPDLLDLHSFLWDRMRAIRMDLRMQHVFGEGSIQMHENMVRFHILAMHELCEYPKGTGVSRGFDAHLNIDQMNKTFVDLFSMYDGQRRLGNRQRNESEFRGYYALLKIDSHPGFYVQPTDLTQDLKKLPQDVVSTPELMFARQVARAYKLLDFRAFFQLARRATYLQCCLMHAHFQKIRLAALRAAYRSTAGGGVPMHCLEDWLCMEPAEVERLLELNGIPLNTSARLVADMDGRKKRLERPKYDTPKVSQLVASKRATWVADSVTSCGALDAPATPRVRLPPPASPSFPGLLKSPIASTMAAAAAASAPPIAPLSAPSSASAAASQSAPSPNFALFRGFGVASSSAVTSQSPSPWGPSWPLGGQQEPFVLSRRDSVGFPASPLSLPARGPAMGARHQEPPAAPSPIGSREAPRVNGGDGRRAEEVEHREGVKEVEQQSTGRGTASRRIVSIAPPGSSLKELSDREAVRAREEDRQREELAMERKRRMDAIQTDRENELKRRREVEVVLKESNLAAMAERKALEECLAVGRELRRCQAAQGLTSLYFRRWKRNVQQRKRERSELWQRYRAFMLRSSLARLQNQSQNELAMAAPQANAVAPIRRATAVAVSRVRKKEELYDELTLRVEEAVAAYVDKLDPSQYHPPDSIVAVINQSVARNVPALSLDGFMPGEKESCQLVVEALRLPAFPALPEAPPTDLLRQAAHYGHHISKYLMAVSKEEDSELFGVYEKRAIDYLRGNCAIVERRGSVRLRPYFEVVILEIFCRECLYFFDGKKK